MDASCIITETVTFGVQLPLRSNDCTRGKPDNKAKTIEHIKVYSFHVALFRSLITLDSQLKRFCGCRNIHAFAVKLAGELVILSGKICVSFYFPRLGYPGGARSCGAPGVVLLSWSNFARLNIVVFLARNAWLAPIRKSTLAKLAFGATWKLFIWKHH